MKPNNKNTNDLNDQRRRAVQLRLAGSTLAEVRKDVGLSNPTIIAAVKAFKEGGWAAVEVNPRGRPRRQGKNNTSPVPPQQALLQAMHNDSTELWNTSRVQQWLQNTQQKTLSVQTAANYLHTWQLLPSNLLRQFTESKSTAATTWMAGEYKDFKNSAKSERNTVLWFGVQAVENNATHLYVHTLRGRCLWYCVSGKASSSDFKQFFTLLCNAYPKGIALIAANKLLAAEAIKFAQDNGKEMPVITAPALRSSAAATTLSTKTRQDGLKATNKPTTFNKPKASTNTARRNMAQPNPTGTAQSHQSSGPSSSKNAVNHSVDNHRHLPGVPATGLTHLQLLEAESIHIMREVVAEAENPVMLNSFGKDSSVMFHLARKAFYPADPPFPMLHIDTQWKFQEMYRYRDSVVEQHGFELLTHVNPEGVAKNVNPFTHGSALHTDIMKTDALKQAIDKHGFDVAFAGARRDEEASRGKERVFSFRTSQHRWDPKNQRPECWNLFNTRKQPEESLRVYPLSNWTELDIWQYINAENISICPLYFAAERPVVERDGSLIVVDDERMQLNDGEVPMMRSVRFRTLGCYPLTSAIESDAGTLPDILQEMLVTNTSERHGRLIDHDTAASMEKKKQQGYF